MTRHKRSFGAPPAFHRKEARRISKSMRGAVKVFNTAMKQGNCKRALEYLVTVEALGSALYREREDERVGKRFAAGAVSYGASHRGTRPMRYKMEKRFIAKCVRD